MTTAGEGGMVTTNDSDLWSKMWSFKDHGKSWDAVYRREHPPGFRWLHESFGTNWRMIEVQAVIGRIQLARMPVWHAKRLGNALKIWGSVRAVDGLRVPVPSEDYEHAAYKCYVFVDQDRLLSSWNRDRIVHEVMKAGVPCYAGSCSEIYLEKAFDDTGWRPADRLPVAKELGETSLMFLVHPTLSTDEVEKTCQVLQAVMARAVA